MAQSLTAVRARINTAAALMDSRGADDDLQPRICAGLLRIALENSLDELWRNVSPRMASVSMRAQLLVLPKFLGARLAGEAGLLWSELSSTTHHHDYVLDPAVDELRRWKNAAERIVAAVADVITRWA